MTTQGAAGPDPGLRPFVSVVVPVYNRADLLGPCLASLMRQTYPRERYEIIVVDDGSTDGSSERTLELARGWKGSLRLVRQVNGGPASARNAGARDSEADVIAFTDSDCVADPDWLDGLISALAPADAAGVGGPIRNAAPRTWVGTYLDAAAFYRHRVRGDRVDYLITGNAAFRRHAFWDVGGFVERRGVWGEDADLSFRLAKAGYRLLLSPGGAVTHNGSPPSVSGLLRELYRYGHGNSILSSEWNNGRTPPVEFARHMGAAVLSPFLAASYVKRVGVWRACAFWPLIMLEHFAFSLGVLVGAVSGERKHGRPVRQRRDGHSQ